MTEKPLIKKYQRDRAELPVKVRLKKLKAIMRDRNLNAYDVSQIVNREKQTVRCWLSEENRRHIPMEHLQTIFNHYGYDLYLDFE